jgi:hypothetical protein
MIANARAITVAETAMTVVLKTTVSSRLGAGVLFEDFGSSGGGTHLFVVVDPELSPAASAPVDELLFAPLPPVAGVPVVMAPVEDAPWVVVMCKVEVPVYCATPEMAPVPAEEESVVADAEEVEAIDEGEGEVEGMLEVAEVDEEVRTVEVVEDEAMLEVAALVDVLFVAAPLGLFASSLRTVSIVGS